MTSTPLRQFFPTLGVVILLGFFLYNMTAPSPGTQGTAHAAPAAPTTDVPTVITVRCATVRKPFPYPAAAAFSGSQKRPGCMKKRNAACR